jgi:hypothetical protein
MVRCSRVPLSPRTCAALAVSVAALVGLPHPAAGFAQRQRVHPHLEITTPACGDVEFPTSATGSWAFAGGVDVFSNGPSYEGGTGDCSSATSKVNGVVAGQEWQCPEFVNRLYLSEGWITGSTTSSSPAWPGNAGPEFYDEAPSNLTKQLNGSVSYLGPGDVVVINVYNYGAPDGGHVLVVNDSSDVSSGTVNLVSQNSGSETNSEPVVQATISGGSVTNVTGGNAEWTYTVYGVVHAPTKPPATAFETAFDASGGAGLWSAGTGPGAPGPIDWKLGIAPGTSPSITALSAGGFEMAFNASGGGGLWTVGSGPGSVGAIDWKLGVESGTSPSITALPAGGFEVAFNASGGAGLWSVGHGPGSVGATDWKLGMMSGTSPSITALSAGGFEMAFNASGGGGLWTVGSGPGSVGAIDWKLGMDTHSSPGITSTSQGGFQMAFNASGGAGLWTVGHGPGSFGADEWKLGVSAGTSPGIAWL